MSRLGLYGCYCTEVAEVNVPQVCEHHGSGLVKEVAAADPVAAGHKCGEPMSAEDSLIYTLMRDPDESDPTYTPAPRLREPEPAGEEREAS